MIEALLWASSHLETFFALLFTANAALLAFVIILENREPERSQGWLLVLFAFPIIGFIIYLFFGHNWHRKTLKERQEISRLTPIRRGQAKRRLDELNIHENTEHRLRALASSVSGILPTSGNHVRILTNAQEKYPALIKALKSAKKSIDMEYFCFRHDEIGKEIIEILKERARSGIRVRFLADGYGSIGLGIKAFRGMRAAGIKAHFFAPLATFLYFFKANYRDHRKVVIIDDETVITGGINIGMDYLGLTGRGSWRDTAIELKGPCVSDFIREFDLSWRRTTFQKPKPLDFVHPSPKPLKDGCVVNVIPSGPDADWFAIQRLYLEMINSASSSILIQTPYFIPDASIHEALINAALRGVDVVIMTPKHTDLLLCKWVSITYFGELLRAGAHIFDYTTGFLHQKVTVVDKRIASVGTCNIDIRSLKTDFEINALFSDSSAVKKLLDDADQDLLQSVEYTFEDYLRRPFIHRVRESFARLVAPLL